jgi:hypothetical protein
MRAIVLVIVLILPLLALGDDLDMPSSIQEVKKQHEARFLDMPGVVSVGMGLDPNGNQAIIVGGGFSGCGSNHRTHQGSMSQTVKCWVCVRMQRWDCRMIYLTTI